MIGTAILVFYLYNILRLHGISRISKGIVLWQKEELA